MALVNCPECGKEISDSANACPNCGYEVKSLKNSSIITSPWKKSPLIVISLIVMFIIAILAVIIIYRFKLKQANPFSELKDGMSQTEVHNLLGSPYHCTDEYDNIYSEMFNAKIYGMKGSLLVNYVDGKLLLASWILYIPDGKAPEDCTSQIIKLKKWMANACQTEVDYSIEQQIDQLGNRYSIIISDENIIVFYNPY